MLKTPFLCAEDDGKNTTCAVLATLAESSEFFSCTADKSEPCDSVVCSRLGYTAVIVLLPCVTPAAIRLVISGGDEVLHNQTLDQSGVIVIPELADLTLDITIDHFDDAMGLEVSLSLSVHVSLSLSLSLSLCMFSCVCMCMHVHRVCVCVCVCVCMLHTFHALVNRALYTLCTFA